MTPRVHDATINKEVQMTPRTTLYTLTLFLLLMPLAALADLTLAISAEKEVTVVKNGVKEVRRTKSASYQPGDIIIYTISYRNNGKEAATNAVIDDPIPRNTSYIDGSATGAGADISFSIDKGKSYKKPMLLSYEVKKPTGQAEKRQAKPEEYTNIRWTIGKVPAGGSGTVEFRVKVK